MSYSQSIVANISLQTATQTQQGFGTPIFIAAHSLYAERVRGYSSLKEMTDDNFSTTDNAYIAAQQAFSQSPAVPIVKIGRREEIWTGYIASEASLGDVYSFTVNLPSIPYSTSVSHTAASGKLAQDDIATALKDIIDGDSTLAENLDATKVGTGAGTSLVVTTKTGAEFFTISEETGEFTGQLSSTESPSDTLLQIDNEDNDYYFVCAEDHSNAYIKLMSAAVESKSGEYFTSKYSIDELGAYEALAVDKGVINELKDAGRDGTVVLFHQDSDAFIEMSWVGSNAPYDAGSITWCNTQAVGASTSKNPATDKPLTSTQKTNLTNKNANYVEADSNNPYFRTGVTSGGEWIDVIRGVDWMKSDLTASLKSLILGQKGTKVPYTEVGEGMVREAVMSSLQRAVNQGFINSDYKVTVPQVNKLDATQRVSRILDGVTFAATLQGAIHEITISGTVSA